MISAVSEGEPSASGADSNENVTTQHPWLKLEPERFQLIRLNALPADREVGLRPLRFVSLGRVERHSKEESFLRLTVNVPGLKTAKDLNTLEVWADHQSLQI